MTLPEDEWLSLMRTRFDGAYLRLNNYTPEYYGFVGDQTFAYRHPYDSRLVIPALGVDETFDVAVARQDPYSIYINDMSSLGFGVDTHTWARLAERALMFSIHLEDEGDEIFGNCVSNFWCFCGAGVPWANLDDARIDIFLSLGAENDKLVITDIRAEMVHGEMEPLFCGSVQDFDQSEIERQMVLLMWRSGSRLEYLLNSQLQMLGVTEPISGVVIGNEGQLHVFVRRVDPDCR